jgi:putative colanic acid biosynthesis glycosyltransferase WcaI
MEPMAIVDPKMQATGLSGGNADADTGSRKILIHGMNFAPELLGVGRYVGQLAEYLTIQGESVEVITTVPHYPGWKRLPPYRRARYYSEYLGGVKIVRCPLILHPSGRGIWRLIAPLSFALASAPIAIWRIFRKRPNVVICIEPTLISAPFSALAAKLVGARRILYVQDLEIDAAFNMRHLKNSFLKQLAKMYERILLQRFEFVITISRRMSEQLVRKGVRADRVTVLRNWIDTSKIRRLDGPNYFRQQLGLTEDDFVVLYAGQIGPKQGLHIVVEAAKQCRDNPAIHFVIAGEGPLKATLVKNHSDLNNLHFLPMQPEQRLCELLNLASIHILPQERDASDLVLPSKLAGMLASGRPILVTADPETELHDLLHGTAIIVPPGETKTLVAAIKAACAQRPFEARNPSSLIREFSASLILPEFHRVIRLS